MRQLTFRGFLSQYARALSYAKTNGIYKLAAEASSNNPRLREPLFLYALLSGKENVLLKATKDAELKREYKALLVLYDKTSMYQALQNNEAELPERYLRVYRSYVSVANNAQNENHLKLLMREYIVQLQREKGISTYRIYTDLKINHGNMNAYIKHGNCANVGLETVRRIIAYLEG